MEDKYGDGMCCDYGNGKFTVSYDGVTTVRSNVISNSFVTGFEMKSGEFGGECSPTPPPTNAVSESVWCTITCC